ncbi:MAG: hypothetical protein P8Y18_04350 [Candidatus Bathyarchaeota archaeon]
MPQKVICEKCGFVLYEGSELKPPDEIIQNHDGKCSKCGKISLQKNAIGLLEF